MRQRFLTLLKDGETYLFSYEHGEETQLYLALMEYGVDPRHCLDWDEVMAIIDEVDRLTSRETDGSAASESRCGYFRK